MWRINSVEEITTTTTESLSEAEDEEEDYFKQLGLNGGTTPLKVPFPEAGIDFIDPNSHGFHVIEEELQKTAVKWYDFENWEENWLFKKRKKSDYKSNIMLGYMSMILAELPVAMLIPNPNNKVFPAVGEREVDELSELSEHNSVGSLDLSDFDSEEETDVLNDGNGDEVENSHKNNEYIETEILNTIECKTTKTNGNNDSNETKVVKTTEIVGNKAKPKPNVNLITFVPKFMPKELRINDTLDNSDPYLVLKPGDASVQSGITVQFCSRAKGTKPLLFSWFKSDSILKSDENFRIFQSGEQNILEIKKTSAEYSAQYSCVVYNRFGYQWCDFNLEVRELSFQSNKMPNNNQNLRSKTVSNCEVISKITNYSKHEKQKTRPIVVIQRTWAERVAEIENFNSNPKGQDKEIEMFENIEELSDKENDTNLSVPNSSVPMTGTIAEREHKKWENPDIQLQNNPYSCENLNLRRERKNDILSDESFPEEIEDNNEDEEEVNTSFLSSKSKDLSRYQKDYYIKEKLNKEETLRSFEENEYSNSKYFNPNPNSTQRKSSEDMSQISEISIDKSSNGTESELILSDSDSMLPSVKDLVNKFSTNDTQCDSSPKLVDIKMKNSLSDSKINVFNKNVLQINQQNFKVHSLTARSLTKEFREMSNLNIPRTQRTRMGINGQNRPNSLVESESSSPSTTTCSPTNEGYASDESNSSIASNCGHLSVALNKNKSINERKFSQSILKRASYWQKRCEQGLISDSSVNEEFPPMETIVD